MTEEHCKYEFYIKNWFNIKNKQFFLLCIKMGENTDLTYYQRNRDFILNIAKDFYKNNKEKLKSRREINTETYLKKKKIKKENTGRIDNTICLKKKSKD